MIIVVEQRNAQEHAHLIDQMFRLRGRVFGDRLKWDVKLTDGKERDRYDDLGPVYIIDTDEAARQVRGSLRLLPTTGPTVLADFFADTMPDAARLSAPSIWECTRFCIDEEIVGKGRREQIVASGALIAGLGEIAIRSGIESILGNFDATMLRLYRRIGCDVEVLGTTGRYGDPVYLGLFPVSETILRQVKSRLGGERQPVAPARSGHRVAA
jgi:N-acyl-L-homoserine lactone synthetase